MKKLLALLFIFSLFLLSSCSKQVVLDPTDDLNKYIGYWEDYNFEQMYEMLTEETKEKYSKEDFVDRYEKIYRDLQINDLMIYYTALDDENEAEDESAEEKSYRLDISMNSIGGPISFASNVTLHLVDNEEKEDEKQKWLLSWSPQLIFSELTDNGKIKVEKVKPKRGEILDRNNIPLAINDIAYEVGVVPNNFQNETAEKQQIANLLNMSVNAIEDRLQASWVEPHHFVPLRIVPRSNESALLQLQSIPAVTMRETIGRMYPLGEAAAHLVGYVGKITDEELKKAPEGKYREDDFIGKLGLESIFEDRLRGEEGVKIFIVNETETGQEQTTLLAEREVVNGENLQLTIDINLQEQLYEAYENKYSGTAAAIHPKTGEVLALVSSPSFNPVELTYGITQSRWDALLNNEQQPLFNRFAATFAPGSVIKPIVGAIGLSNGSITHNEVLKIEGLTWKKDNWKDFHIKRVSTGTGKVDLKDAIVRSDNIYFAMKAIDMGNDALVKGLQAFGFDENIPLDIPIKASQISNANHLQNEVLRANTAYGQGEVEMSSLHVALTYTPFLNEGNLIKPVLFTSDKKSEIWRENIISKEDSEKMQDYLRAVITDGTARSIDDPDFPIAGKTGTAELKETHGTKGHENGWFVGYPTKEQNIIIAMLMEHVENVGTSTLVSNKVAEIMKEYTEN